ncbi:hypothetical protein DCS_04173 [Drechmeria coniospora]|uniref:Chalcone isomerase domain-containing protein n=1 Tax=Drechmeria coniospora TaxID=98403 RepID=A0A151GJ99_DRECN|nr:hypothetical protein DCS_04173 [Drechmeria coniospora]KYK57166.1 hypothetical protein DCS_04173 [Drechmeria coniospora]
MTSAMLRLVPRTLPSRCAPAALRRTLFSHRPSARATEEFDITKLNAKRRDYEQNRTAFLAAGALAGIVSFVYTAWKLKQALDGSGERSKLAVKCDAPSSIPTETFKTEAGEKRKVVLHDDEGREIIPTGHGLVKAFPRAIELDMPTARQGLDRNEASMAASISDEAGVEFTLVGLGMRTVTFIGIQVYLVGLYVATQDIARLQHHLVKKINPLATTLIPTEKEALRKALLDAVEGDETWDSILQESGCRTALRIVPVRDTDFHHLRDGFVRAIQARSQRGTAYNDEAFAGAMKRFKVMFNRGSVPKKKELLLCRDGAGALSVLYGDGERTKKREPTREVMGTVDDERLSRLLWLNYLSGSKVASEEARRNIIEGIMELVERPVGTVAAQVV